MIETVPAHEPMTVSLKSNALPWLIAMPNIGAEFSFASKWSAAIDVMYCPWKIPGDFSVKTLAILPEGRFWLKNNSRGSFFNLHMSVAWYNVRSGHLRYQDNSLPLLGAGIGYGYRFRLAKRWSLELNVGFGFASLRYDRYANIPNGDLLDSRKSVYWGLDRIGAVFVYEIGEL